MKFTLNGLVYETINEDKEVMLRRTEGLKRPVRNIPAEVEYEGKKYKVTEVYGGEFRKDLGAFQSDDILTNLSLPETVKIILDGTIGSGFASGAISQCPKLKDVNLPDSLTYIGKLAFAGCTSIESIYFGDGLTSVGENAFENCKALKEVDFNDKLETIGFRAFYGCSSLKNVAFPESLKKIGGVAFCDCKAMTEVNIPASVESIEYKAFYGSGVKVVNIYSENINIASDAFPSDAQINFLDANSFPKRKRKARGNKTVEPPKATHVVEEPKKETPKPEPKKEEPKPAPKPEPKKETPKVEAAEQPASGEGMMLAKNSTVAEIASAFKSRFGSVLRIYNGRSKAESSETLGNLGLTQEGEFVCRASLTVGSFIERMQSEFGLKVKVYTCDEWVAVLDGLTLETSGKVKKNAVRADMENMIAYQRKDAYLNGYTIKAEADGSYTVCKDGVVCDNAKGAMREISSLIGFEYDTEWNTRQFGKRLLAAIENGATPITAHAAAQTSK